MAEEAGIIARVLASPLDVDPVAWNALLASQSHPTPFLRHEYLAAMHRRQIWTTDRPAPTGDGFIITANYQDRLSPDRWLIRGEAEQVDQARAVRQLLLRDVELGSSRGYPEWRLGCTALARVAQLICRSTSPTYCSIRRAIASAFSDWESDNSWVTSE